MFTGEQHGFLSSKLNLAGAPHGQLNERRPQCLAIHRPSRRPNRRIPVELVRVCSCQSDPNTVPLCQQYGRGTERETDLSQLAGLQRLRILAQETVSRAQRLLSQAVPDNSPPAKYPTQPPL